MMMTMWLHMVPVSLRRLKTRKFAFHKQIQISLSTRQ